MRLFFKSAAVRARNSQKCPEILIDFGHCKGAKERKNGTFYVVNPRNMSPRRARRHQSGRLDELNSRLSPRLAAPRLSRRHLGLKESNIYTILFVCFGRYHAHAKRYTTPSHD
jgi:hypothetical protein